jgi:hypothetical protein
MSGSDNRALGFLALQFNTTSLNNTAFGTIALRDNTTGGGNTAVGTSAPAFPGNPLRGPRS